MTHLRIAQIPAEPIDPSLSPKEVAEILSIDASTVRKMAKDGLLRWHHVGCGNRDIRIFQSSVEEYRENRTGASPAKAPATGSGRRRRRSTAAYNEAIAYGRVLGIV